MEPLSRTEPPAAARRPPYALLLGLVTTALCAACWWFPSVMGLMGIGHGGLWFRDVFGILAAVEAQRQGMDPYLPNVLGAQHNYSHWWLWLEHTSWIRRDAMWLGLLTSGLGLVAGWLVTRPRSAAELGWTLLVFCSAPLLLGLNRANVDWLLFALLSLLVPCVLAPAPGWRRFGPPLLIAFATGLKYYPAVAILLLLAVRPRTDRRVALGLAAVLLALTFASVGPDLARFTGVVTHEGFYVFGAPASFRKFGQPGGLAPVAGIVLLAAAGWWLARRPALREWSVPPTLRAEHLNFILGAVILTGCFLLTANYAYRWIFALWLMPFLCRLEPADPRLRRLKNLTRGLLVLQLWGEVGMVVALNLHPVSTPVLQRCEYLTTTALAVSAWGLFACLAGWLVHFTANQWRIAAADNR